MRCLSCKYDLSHLTEHRCPECGRGFDPALEATFDPTPRSPSASARERRRKRIRAAIVRSIVCIVFLALVVIDWHYVVLPFKGPVDAILMIALIAAVQTLQIVAVVAIALFVLGVLRRVLPRRSKGT